MHRIKFHILLSSIFSHFCHPYSCIKVPACSPTFSIHLPPQIFRSRPPLPSPTSIFICCLLVFITFSDFSVQLPPPATHPPPLILLLLLLLIQWILLHYCYLLRCILLAALHHSDRCYCQLCPAQLFLLTRSETVRLRLVASTANPPTLTTP